MEDAKQQYVNGSIQSYGLDKISQETANYNPFGFTGQQGCATCRWFKPEYNGCHVVEGAIVPTGLSDLYNPLRPQDQMQELLDDFAESMGDVTAMDRIGEAATDEKGHKRTLIDRLLRRNKGEIQEEKPVFDTPSGFKTIGDNLWVAWYTNPYRDRDGEWFAEKAIDADIAFMNETKDFPELWRYHIGKPKNSPVKHGKAFAVTKAGRIVVAFGEFDNTPLADAFKAYYKENPDQALSHGFFYDPDQKKDGVYHKFHTFEISTLPPNVAANPFTNFGIKTGEKTMPAANEKAIADLKSVLSGKLPEAQLNEVLQAAAAKSAELDQAVSFKNKPEEETKEEKEPELSPDTKAILGAFADLGNKISAMQGEIVGLKAKIAPMMAADEDDEDDEDGAKKPPKKGKAARPTAQTLSPEITAVLRTLVEEKGLNEDSAQIESRDLDPATSVLNKMFGGSK
jgi:hypothetical protein